MTPLSTVSGLGMMPPVESGTFWNMTFELVYVKANCPEKPLRVKSPLVN